MRIKMIAGGAVLALGLMGATGAMAVQSSADALSGTVGATTCEQFTQMSPTAQADFVKQIGAENPTTSLTSNSGSGNTAASGSGSSMGNSTDAAGSTAGSLGVQTQLTGGQLIAACQAASPSSTLQDAFSHFSSGNNPAANGVKSP